MLAAESNVTPAEIRYRTVIRAATRSFHKFNKASNTYLYHTWPHFLWTLQTAPMYVLNQPVSTVSPTTCPLPLSCKPWIGDSESAESGPFSPLVFSVPRPATYPILGSSESCFGGGSAPMVVSRISGRAMEDGSGFWRLSYPQLVALSSAALPVDSPWEAPAAAALRAAVLRSASPSRYLTTRPFTASVMSSLRRQDAVI